jgi:hypothetical protein
MVLETKERSPEKMELLGRSDLSITTALPASNSVLPLFERVLKVSDDVLVGWSSRLKMARTGQHPWRSPLQIMECGRHSRFGLV